MSDEAVCRTAPATPGLLIIFNQKFLFESHPGQGDWAATKNIYSQKDTDSTKVSRD